MGRLVARDDLGERDVGGVQLVALAVAGAASRLKLKVVVAVACHVDGVEQAQQATVVDVGVGDDDALAARGEALEEPLQKVLELGLIVAKAAVNKQQRLVVLEHVHVAAAGRLDGVEHEVVGQTTRGDDGVEILACVLGDEAGEALDVGKRLLRRLLALVEGLHDLRGIGEHRVGLVLREVEQLAHLVGKGHVEDRAVKQVVRAVVVKDAHLADLRDVVDELLDLGGVLHHEAHLEVLIRRAVFL